MPGIGPRFERSLNENGVMSTFILLGKFLTMKDLETESVEHCERFYQYLKSIDSTYHHANKIVASVAEKFDCMFPGLYDEAIYEGDQHLEIVCG